MMRCMSCLLFGPHLFSMRLPMLMVSSELDSSNSRRLCLWEEGRPESTPYLMPLNQTIDIMSMFAWKEINRCSIICH